ncbi:MAG: DEAD/DEAH box helicase [Candidatus Thiodiazotropha endolucinida]
MKFIAHNYQQRGVDWILNIARCALWKEMGLGKTVTTLTAITKLMNAMVIRKVLIIAPLRVAQSTWPAEVEKWDHTKHLTYSVVVGAKHERRVALWRDADIDIINYENLQWLIDYFLKLKRWPFDIVVCDESTKLKSFRLRNGSKRAMALAKTIRATDRWVNLTGTPAPQGLIDLWGQTYFLDLGKRLGSTFTAFKNRWFIEAPNGYGVVPNEIADKEIHERLGDICLSMKAEDYLEMPKLINTTIDIDLPVDKFAEYSELEREMYLQLSNQEKIEAVTAATLTNKCLQYANGAVYLTDDNGRPTTQWRTVHDAKLEAMDSVIAEATGAPILVAYNFKSDLARLKERYKHAVVLDKNPETIERWNKGEIQLLLAHPASAGHGLNLQAGGNIIVWYGLKWSLELCQLFVARLYRQGQEKSVFIYHLVVNNTIDEQVMEAIEHKRTVQDQLMLAMAA